MYCTIDEVYATAGITSDEIPRDNILNFILQAEGEVDRFTNTTYWSLEEESTATDGDSTTLTNSNVEWDINEHSNNYVWIYGGTGSGQVRKISSNTATALTVSSSWSTNPDNTSTYRIIHSGKDPYVENELRDGDDTDTIFLDKYPLVVLESVTSNSTSVTPDNIYQYKKMGKLVIGTSTAEVSNWTSYKAQKNSFTYYYGVYPIPYEVKRLCLVYASLKVLMAQAGGTHNIPSTYSLPEGSVTIGQAYINIRGAWDMLNKEREQLERTIVRYVSNA